MKLLLALLMLSVLAGAQSNSGCSGITFTTGALNRSGPCYGSSHYPPGPCSATQKYSAYCYTASSTYASDTALSVTGTGLVPDYPTYPACSPTPFVAQTYPNSDNSLWVFQAHDYDEYWYANASVCKTGSINAVTWTCTEARCVATDKCGGCGASCLCNPTTLLCQCSPIVLAPHGKFAMTDIAHGVRFRMNPGENYRQISWPKGDTGWLVLPDANGEVKTFDEMFRDYNALGLYDLETEGGNGNGQIDPGDQIYSRLRVWINSSRDGVSKPEELHTLDSLGYRSIGLAVHYTEQRDPQGNWFRYVADDKKSCDVLVSAESLRK